MQKASETSQPGRGGQGRLSAIKNGYGGLIARTEALGDFAFLIALTICCLISVLAAVVPWLIPIPSVLLGIFPFALIGVRANYRLKELRQDLLKENECLERFGEGAKELWSRLKPAPTAMISKANIIDLVDAPTRRQSRHAKDLMEQISNGNIYLIDAPNDSILRPFRDNLEGRYREALSFASLSTKLGILGTFIGFVLALLSLGGLFAGLGPDIAANGRDAASPAIDWARWSKPIRSTLNDLAFAFVTSIYGLVLAVLIQVQAGGVRRPIERFYKLCDEALSYGREFVNRMTLADPAIHASLTQVRNSLKNVEQRLFDHGERIAGALGEHANVINDESQRFSTAAQGMVDVQARWDGALRNLKDVAAVFDARTAEMIVQIERGLGGAAAKFDTALQALGASQQELAQSRESVAKTVVDVDEAWKTRLEALMAEGANQQQLYQGWSQHVSDTVGELRQEFRTVDGGLKSLEASLKASIEGHKSVADALSRLNSSLEAQHLVVPAMRHRRWSRIVIWLLLIGGAVAIEVLVLDDPLGLNRVGEDGFKWLEARWNATRR